ncbi:TMEM165/GDT1 family protein [Calothrix sp. UHCC 0171]|uniref:TMEM165/GDT1 family protein n=1 Tax=Calothrix sp. UHCC 0171 TaxID=3110245 RepID=UPI002B1FE920|nr:TMEM165/GDT1 family protein [Calothrix sp. UHCC 0171]MEA5569862.1 TMEM165/GDT1 family protein [Calothrix sp. UHCC 0171]
MLTAFTAGLTVITASELLDKTFFIAMYLAMKHSRWLIFSAATSALAAMTILSVALGQFASFLPKNIVHHLEIALFLGFGLKLIYDAYKMPVKNNCDRILEEAEEAVDKAEGKLVTQTNWGIWLEGFLLTFIAEWGDRTQLATISLAINNNPFGVTAGGVLGHAICTVIAVTCGKMLCGRITERQLTFVGGGLFILFGILAIFEKN